MEVAGWFVGPFMNKIIKGCFDYLEEQVGWQTGMKKELERLRENHPKIQAVVFAANQAQISDQNPALNEWIWQLRDALDEVNDVLDEFEYMKHKEQLNKNMEETEERTAFSNVSFLVDGLRIAGERALKIDPRLKRLEEVLHKLDNVSAGVSNFLPLLDLAKQGQQEKQRQLFQARETGSLPTTNDLIGRGKDMESVLNWLRKPSNEHRGTSRYRNISLLSIVGHGGMGKTTLLQHVYDDEMTDEFFDLKMWVCVSNNFDVKKVIAVMLESLDQKKPDLDSLEALQGRLKNKVKSKRFLLVLDDVWEEEEERDKSKWGNVLAPLASGGFGSKILVTTRTDSVALMFKKVIQGKKETLRLQGLEEEECLKLLNTHAFVDVDNLDDQRKLKLITAGIVKKLSGSPLAAKVIGGILNSNLDEGHWRRVLDSVLEIIKLGQNDIMLVLRLSYVHLPQHLKSCFTFCSIFPQDYKFDKDALVRMWIALGFIQPSHIPGEIMEDIGGRYFDDLVKKSFFDKFHDRSYYKMHDLIHELAQSVSKYECLRVGNDTELPSIIPKTLRHLFVQTKNSDIIKNIGQFKYLHSLFLFYEACNQDFYNALVEVLKASRSLRLLWVFSADLKMIPEEIGNLIHLRYLKIDCYNLTMLPRSLSNLYHLKYIDARRGPSQSKVDFLPSDINNLSNLCYMELPDNNSISSICGIGKLKYLPKLNNFVIRDVSGYRIGELENMNDLCKLEINCLENVKDAEEACSANLCAKRRLTDLTLRWSDNNSRKIDLDENVLNNLQPPKCLKNLSIERYMGARSAIWLNNVNPIFNIEKIELRECLECETLPPFGQLPLLKILILNNLPKVKCLQSKFNGNDKYHAFPLLEELHIYRFEALEDWFEAGVAAEDGCLFPSLIQLRLGNNPKLKELRSLPSKLKNLSIYKIGWTTLKFCSNSNPIPLESLGVTYCRNITSLPLADEIARLSALRYLTIRDCPNLISLGSYREEETTNNCHLILTNLRISDPSVLLMEPLRSISFLKRLMISDNDELVSFPNETEQWFLNVRSSLSVLEFKNLESLQSLPSFLESLSSLRVLSITKCPNLISLGSYRKAEATNNCHLMLRDLEISDTSVLLMEPLRSISSLKHLRIENNDEVVSFPNEVEQWFLKVRSSLCTLYFIRLKSLQALPSSLESLSSLECLYIQDIPMLRELPNLPPSLQVLSIWYCHPELKERYREDGGSDRHKIAHIPNIII